MTFVRRAASTVSERVVRWASPGCKEWAEGFAREIEFIDSDWRALAWAIGGTRVLLKRRSDVRPKEKQGTGFVLLPVWALDVAMGTLFGLQAVFMKSWQERVGYVVVALGWEYFATVSLKQWQKERNEPVFPDAMVRRMHLRAVLEQRLERYSTWRRWSSPVVTVAMGCGFVLAIKDISQGLNLGVVAFTAVAIWLQCLDSPAKIQLRLNRMNELIAESGR
ncbi:MAG TPA: hypothetical protein VGU46_08940 [Acidobacteriaceae bacterium]|nr:hypothetical protein [Acidobacteriaceae bacterium]